MIVRPEEVEISFCDQNPPQHTRSGSRAAKTEIGIQLNVVCQRCLDRCRSRSSNADVETHVLQQRVRSDRRLYWWSCTSQDGTNIALRCIGDSFHVHATRCEAF